jgi:eukaryotic-like serine/threonine-protein kinase
VSEPTGRPGKASSETADERRGEHARHEAKIRRGVSTGLIVTIVIGLVALAVVIVVIFLMAKRPATIPNVTMMTEVQATQALTNVRLRVGEISQLATSAVGPGLVVAQRPGSGGEAVAGSQVDLTFAEQPQPAPAPNVVGLKQAHAEAQLQTGQFVVVRYRQYSDTVPTGTVVAQLPAASTEYQTGQPIIISVSLGKATSTSAAVPVLTGKDDVAARQSLALANLVGYWLYDLASTLPQGQVIGQLPGAGALVPPDARVAVWVAGEPR